MQTTGATTRTLELVEDALAALDQAIYEGDHNVRSDPAPREGSPWSSPDLHPDVLVRLRFARAEVERLHSNLVKGA